MSIKNASLMYPCFKDDLGSISGSFIYELFLLLNSKRRKTKGVFMFCLFFSHPFRNSNFCPGEKKNQTKHPPEVVSVYRRTDKLYW